MSKITNHSFQLVCLLSLIGAGIRESYLEEPAREELECTFSFSFWHAHSFYRKQMFSFSYFSNLLLWNVWHHPKALYNPGKPNSLQVFPSNLQGPKLPGFVANLIIYKDSLLVSNPGPSGLTACGRQKRFHPQLCFLVFEEFFMGFFVLIGMSLTDNTVLGSGYRTMIWYLYRLRNAHRKSRCHRPFHTSWNGRACLCFAGNSGCHLTSVS